MSDNLLEIFNLPPTRLDASTLREYEAEVIDAATDMADALFRISWALYVILENKLWQFGFDEDGQPYTRSTDYLRSLSQQAMIGVSTMYDYKKAVKAGLAAGFDYKGIAEKGIAVFLRLIRNTDVDRKGMVIDVEPKRVKETIESVSAAPGGENVGPRPGDQIAGFKQAFGKGPNLWFEREGPVIKWYYERWVNEELKHFHTGVVQIKVFSDEPNVPDEVLTEIKTRVMNKIRKDSSK